MSCTELDRYSPVLRIFKSKGDTYVPLVSPINYQNDFNDNFEQVVSADLFGTDKNVPCFFGNIISANIQESREMHTTSIVLEFPYLPTATFVSSTEEEPPNNSIINTNFFINEAEALKVSEIDSTNIFIPHNFRQSYLYRIDILCNKVEEFDGYLSNFYNGSIDLATINTYIDSNSTRG